MLNDPETLLASATDLLNSWAREQGVKEAENISDIQGVIDRLWSATSMKYFKAVEVITEVSRLDRYIVSDAKRLLETRK